MQSISYYRSNKLSRIIVQVIYNAIELFNSLVSNMNKITINNKCSFRSVINIAEPCMYFNSGYAVIKEIFHIKPATNYTSLFDESNGAQPC